jgi:hypothetical protein
MIGVVLQSLRHAYLYTDPARTESLLPDQLVVARKLHDLPGDKIAMLVSQSERTAQAILPGEQTISSSFRYGGAPAVVWYADKPVAFYYNYDTFTADLVGHAYPLAIVTQEDQNKVPAGYIPLIITKSYSGYGEGTIYAQR